MERGVGDGVERREDPALLTGTASFLDDLTGQHLTHAAVCRSRYAHAMLEGIETEPALELEGVHAVFTATDLASAGIAGSIPVATSLPNPPDSTVRIRQDVVVPHRPLLAKNRVRYQGQPLAIVIADDRYVAHEAVDRIEVSYDREEAVVHPDKALEDGAPIVHDEAPNNVAFDWSVGDPEAVDAAFQSAAHTVRIERSHQRMIGTSLEPRGALARMRSDRLEVAISTQIPHMHQFLLSHVLEIPASRIRVWTPDTGGGFGVKSKYYPEEVLTAWCARELGRPVKWQNTRTASFLSDAVGRAHVGEAEMALDENGTVLAVRVDDRKDLGAFVQRGAPAVNTSSYATLLSSQYAIPYIHCRIRGVFTTATPTDAYRGSSRPEGAYVIERLMDEAASELDIDPVELRRRNLIPADAFPYQTPVLATYDSGDYQTAMDLMLDRLDYDSWRERQAELREKDRYLGIGLACFVEPAGSSPVGGTGGVGVEPAHIESSKIGFYPDGTVLAYCGTSDQGQGHETTYAQILADELGVDADDIEILEGDTDQLNHGVGTHSSRSVIMAGSSLVESAHKVIDRARPIAARQLEVDPADVEFADGSFQVAGAPDRSITLPAVAREAHYATDLPEGVEPGLDATTYYASSGVTFPFGTHAAVVEVDPATGEVTIEEYVAVDDCGVQINPRLVEGQLHGGIAQGIGQALYEGAVYDESGTLLTGSLQDYALPRAGHLPDMKLDHTETPSPLNPLGAKGTGEAGTVGAPIAILNAVLDALRPFDVDHLDLPITPERVWRAIDRSDHS